ncbi:MAG: endolytic transglycosylase MltG [Candidatus Neomarinimicrobiota bacterium]
MIKNLLKKNNVKRHLRLHKTALALAGGLILLTIVYLVVLKTPINLANHNRVISIHSGASLHEIADQLQREDIIRSSKRFTLATCLMLKARKLRAGRFNLKRANNYYQLIMTLAKWDIVTVRVTIPEGLRIHEIAALLAARLGISTDVFIQKAMDPNFTHKLGIPADNLEGYLFPDSYDFIEGDSPEFIIRRMIERFKSVVSEDIMAEIQRSGRTLHQIVIMASIIEGECQIDFERPIVASLYYNRLRKRIRMESCPTIQYILPDSPRRILRTDLKIDSPYNTYKHYGLPPGPVSNPGFKSILAAIRPAKTKYIYMVSNGDSTHTFTTNYDDFLIAKKRLKLFRAQKNQTTDKDLIN